MSEHKASVKWERNGADFGYKSYSRDHVWRFDNGIEVLSSAAPAYLGNPQRVDPESAFVAALSIGCTTRRIANASSPIL
jgi:organic hydroperoxide reductase OsmC/OhrA